MTFPIEFAVIYFQPSCVCRFHHFECIKVLGKRDIRKWWCVPSLFRSAHKKTRSRFVSEANRIEFIFIARVMGTAFSTATHKWCKLISFFSFGLIQLLVNRHFRKPTALNAVKMVRKFHLVATDNVCKLHIEICPKEKVNFYCSASHRKKQFCDNVNLQYRRERVWYLPSWNLRSIEQCNSCDFPIKLIYLF